MGAWQRQGQVVIVMLLQLLQCVQSPLLVVMIQIGQVAEFAVVEHINLRIVAAIALRLIPRGGGGGLGKELIKSHVFIELGKVVLLVPLELVGITVVVVIVVVAGGGLLLLRHGGIIW